MLGRILPACVLAVVSGTGATLVCGREHALAASPADADTVTPDPAGAPQLGVLRSATVSEGLRDCMGFFDANKSRWMVETNDFHPGAKLGESEKNVRVLVLRSSALYEEKSTREKSSPSPLMRVVGFFPTVATDKVHLHLTDVRLRCRWDKNYKFFVQWVPAEEGAGGADGPLPGVSQILGVERPIPTRRRCVGDACAVLPVASAKVLEHGWFAHAVGNSILDKLGIAGRLFVYERQSTVFQLTSEEPSTAACGYDVIFRGVHIHDPLLAGDGVAASLRGWAMGLLTGTTATQECYMNYQHILLLPVADAEQQLALGQEKLPVVHSGSSLFRKLCFGGSIVDELTSTAVYDFLAETEALSRALRRATATPGSLLIMTSANDAKIPSTMPMWAQRQVAGYFTRHAYNDLLKGIRAHEEERRE